MGFKFATSSPDLVSPSWQSTHEMLERVNDLLRDLMARAYSPGERREGFDPVMLFKLLQLER